MASSLRTEQALDFDRGDGIIRWSPDKSRDEFLTINLAYRTLALHKAVGRIDPGRFDYENVSSHTEFQPFGAYDWSPAVPGHDLPGLMAVGTKTGDVHLLRIDDGSNDSASLPMKFPRACHAVAFNTTGQLAIGLDRARNSPSLQVWDISQAFSSWNSTKRGLQNLDLPGEHYLGWETGSQITSTRWFEDQPMTLVAGVKNQGMKVFDMRDPHKEVITFSTKCTNNLAINHKDPNYFASSSLDGPGVMVWDRRAAPKGGPSSRTYVDAVESSDMPWGCVLKLERVIDPSMNTHIRSLRYSRDHSGLLGVLSDAGQLQFVNTEKEPSDSSIEESVSGSPELLQVRSSHDVAYPWFSTDFHYPAENRIVSFDWVPTRSDYHQPRVVTRRGNRELDVILLPSKAQNLAMDLLDFSSKAKQEEGAAFPKVSGEDEAKEVLKPILQMPAKNALDVGTKRTLTTSRTQEALTLQFAEIEAVHLMTGRDSGKDELDVVVNLAERLTLGKISSSRERHELLLSKISTGKTFQSNQPNRVANLMLDRIKRAYLFDWKRNLGVLLDDPWLQDVWTWVGGAEEAAADDGMVSGTLDLAYMGVQSIWNTDLGSHWQSRVLEKMQTPPSEDEWARALEDLNTRSGRGYFDSVPTSRPQHRLMCLAICGWGKSDEELDQDLLAFEAKGLHTKAAAWALFEKKPARAVLALQRGGEDLLFIGLALGMSIHNGASLTKQQWDYSTSKLSTAKTDPYLRAIYTMISTGDWKAICNEASLPLRDRVGVALHNLDDTELPNWLNRQTTAAIGQGDIEGLVLTGINEQFVSLLTTYIDRFGDYQTAALLTGFAAPLYIKDFRVDQWVASYQDLHNKNRLFVMRCHFDVGRTKLSRGRDGISKIKPKPRQVTLRCTHCDTAFANDTDNTAMGMGKPSKKTGSGLGMERNALHSSNVNAGISCPKCGKHLPRCGICLLTLGMPRSDKDIGTGNGLEKLKNFMSFCMKCDHAFHADHARGWFRVHNECPIPECHCACNVDGGGMAGMEREDGESAVAD